MVEDILIALLSALSYSIIFFIKKREKDEGEEYDYFKLGATMIVGLAVGLSIHFSNVDLTQVGFEQRLMLYTGVIAIVESVLKIIVRRIRKMRNSGGFSPS